MRFPWPSNLTPALGRSRLLGRRIILGILVPVGVLLALSGAFFWSDEPEPPVTFPVAAAVAADLPGPPNPNDPPRDQALRLLGEARRACQGVRDYRCTLAIREQVGGQLQTEQVMGMDFRSQPFSVHFRWRQPDSKIGQEVYFVVGKNRGKMRVRPAGGLGALVRFLYVSPNAPSVRENSRHTITEAGLANMLEQFCRSWEQKAPETVGVRLDDAVVDRKPCRRVEVVLVGQEPSAEWRRAVLFVGGEVRLPVRVEYYGQQGELLEEATYRDLKVNVGLTDEAFGS